ncbi:hypothetical protein ACSQ67_018922 [Phaseolus vulgaris]
MLCCWSNLYGQGNHKLFMELVYLELFAVRTYDFLYATQPYHSAGPVIRDDAMVSTKLSQLSCLDGDCGTY